MRVTILTPQYPPMLGGFLVGVEEATCGCAASGTRVEEIPSGGD